MFKSLKINTKKFASPAFLKAIAAFEAQWLSSDDFIVSYTSGSTGAPQPIRLSKANMRASAAATLSHLGLKPQDRALLCLPVDKIAGQMMLVRALEGKLELTPITPSNHPLAGLAPKSHFHFAALVPQQAGNGMESLAQIDKIIIGGGPISQALEHELAAQQGQIFHSYGMTETITHVALRALAPHPTKFFEALPGVTFSVNAQNCLRICAPALGVSDLQSKDVVELHSSGSFSWLGRLDNVVLSGGLKLYPEQLERRLYLRANFFLGGLPHRQLGQQLVAVVEGEQLSEAEQSEALKDLAPQEKPRQWLYLPQFLRTSNGKLRRQASLALALERSGAQR